jgi:hypothetical protein
LTEKRPNRINHIIIYSSHKVTCMWPVLRQTKVDEGCVVFEYRFSYHIIFVSFNSNWSFWWRPSFHSFVVCGPVIYVETCEKLHLQLTHEWFSISSNTNGACESRKVLLSYVARNELFNWLKRVLTVLIIYEGCEVFENRFTYRIIFVSFNSNWSFPWRPSFHSFVLCVVCDAQYLVFCIVYCILIKEQTTQWPYEKVQNDKQRSTKHTYKAKDRVTQTP